MGRRRQGEALPAAAPDTIGALTRGLDVLGCFRRGDRALGNQDIAARVRLPRSTVSRLTATLTRAGWLLHVPETQRYRLGPAAIALGGAALGGLDIRGIARAPMQDLAQAMRAVVALGMRDRLSMLYLEVVRSDAPISLNLEAGSRISLAFSAMGRAWLAAAPAAEREEAMLRLRELDDGAWPRIEAGIARARQDAAATGICCSFGEWQEGVNAIATAFRPGGGLPPMVLNVGAPAFLASPERLLEEARPALLALAAKLDGVLDRVTD